MRKAYPRILRRRHARGVGLIEVMIAMVILAIGLLGLAAMQAATTRATADARARAAATNLAQAKLEEMRTFFSLEADANGDGVPDNVIDTNGDGTPDAPGIAFDQLAGGADAPREAVGVTSGFAFNRVWTVTPCSIAAAGATNCAGVPVARSDFLRVAVQVTWNSVDRPDTLGRVQVEDIVSRTSPLDSAVALTNATTTRESPQVYVQPARIQGTIPIPIGGSQSSASSDPQPNIIRDNLVRTQFEVLTYATNANGLLAKRAFDYTVVGCSCRQSGLVTGVEAYEPSYWNGLTFTRPRKVDTSRDARRTGTALLRNSDPPLVQELCTACCRDHHDSSTSQSPKLSPFRPSTDYPTGLGGDHNHYLPVLSGGRYTLQLANNAGDEYYETCRFIRRDGIYRLTLDARLENLVTTPEYMLDDAAERDAYSQFASQFVNAYVNDVLAYNAGDYAQAPPDRASVYTRAVTGLPTVGTSIVSPATPYTLTSAGTQMVSRAIYIDYMTPDVLTGIRCIDRNDFTTAECLPYQGRTRLELVPFFAINLTRLGTWRPQDDTIATVPLRDRNDPFSRGYAIARANGSTDIIGESPESNIGLTNPVPGQPLDLVATQSDTVPIVVSAASPPPPTPWIVRFAVRIGNTSGVASPETVLLSGQSGTTCVQTGSQGQAVNWECRLDNLGLGGVQFSSFTGTECVRRVRGTCVQQAAVVNSICLTPAPNPAISYNRNALNAYLDTASVSFAGAAASGTTFTADVQRTCN